MASRRLPCPLLGEATSSRIPVLKPQLPSATDLLPLLAEIDENRWYSNGGPLVTRIEEQLSRHFRFVDRGVVTVSNGTLGLTVALMASRIPPGSICLMPSWTFAATPHAARLAGLTPWFHDVDRRTWALNPDAVTETLKGMSRPVRAIIVVCPFGAPIDVRAWEEFQDRTGIAVIVDAAAAFDTVRRSHLPFVVSLHATKILGAGEGGFIASSDSKLLARARACCNFGFQGSRNAMLGALNAKMSEYHAAVALAAWGSWGRTRQLQARVVEWYRRGVARMEHVSLQPRYGDGWVSGTTNVLLPARLRDKVSRQLLESGIETRTWWGAGCHRQPAFIDCPRSTLPVTDELGERVLGLPHFPDMQKRDVDAVLAALPVVQADRAGPRWQVA